MAQAPARAAFAAAAILAVGGCGRPAGTPASVVAIRASRSVQNPCEGALRAADLADLLGVSGLVARSSPTDPESCAFDGPGDRSVVVTLRADDEVEPFWKLAVDRNRQAMVPMPSVGDAALRRPDASEVLIRKGRLSCQVDVAGLTATGADRDVRAARLAALCARLIAGYRF